jgi:hypothetical protein
MVSGSFHFARLHDIGEREKRVVCLTINYSHDGKKNTPPLHFISV